MFKVQINCQLTLTIFVYCFSFVCYMKYGFSQTNEINAVMIVISCNVTIAVSVICLNSMTPIK